MLLARLLTPGDYGIYGMTMSVVGIMLVFRDGGIESTLLNRQEVSRDELAGLNSFNALLGAVFALIVVGLGPLLAWWFDEPRLIGAAAVAAVSFLIYGLDVQPAALLLRARRFKARAVIELVALVFGLTVAVNLAGKGYGYWALFAVDIAVALALLLGHWRTARWRPEWSHPWRKTRELLQFGGSLSVVRLLGHFVRNVDLIIIGWALGAVPLAFYIKAVKLVNLPHEAINWPLTRVAVPTLSGLREDPAAYRATFRRLNEICAALGLPLVVWMGLSADHIVPLLYGDQWGASVELVQILAALGAMNMVLSATSWVYISVGRINRQVFWELGSSMVLITGFLIGVRHGLGAAAITASVLGCSLRIGSWFYTFHRTPVKVRDILAAIVRPGVAASIALGVGLAGQHFVEEFGAGMLINAIGEGVVVAVTYSLVWRIAPGFWTHLRSLGNDAPQSSAT